MRRNHSHLTAIVFVILYLPSFAQVDLTRYFDKGALPLINRSKPLKVEVKWNMDGKSQAMLNECLNYLDEGRPVQALANIDSFVNINYKMWVGHYYRGQALMRLGKFREAEVEFTLVTKINPDLPEGYLELGESQEAQNNFPGAREQFNKALFVDSKFVYAHYKLGNLSLASSFFPVAITHYKKCNKIDPKFPDAYMALGIISYLSKKSSEAITYFGKSLQADSTFTQAYFWRGLSLLEQNKKEACLQDWGLFITYNPRDQFVRTMRGFLHAELKNFDEAFSDFRKVLLNTSINEDKFRGGQTSLDKRIDMQFAMNYLMTKGYGLKDEVFTNLKAGFCLMLMDRDREAIESLRKAERMSSSPAIYFLMAVAYEHGGIHQMAFQYYNKTLEYDNDVFDAHKKRSIYFSELKQWQAAYHDINEMLRLQPGAPIAFKLRGLMEASQKKFSEAIADLTSFVNSDSTDLDALRNRALCYSLSNQQKAATKDLARIYQFNTSTAYREALIADLVAAKDTVNALYSWKDYYRKIPATTALAEIIKILIAQKKYSEAMLEINSTREKLMLQVKKTGEGIQGQHRNMNSVLYQLEGGVALAQSAYARAIDLFTTSLKENPTNVESRYLRSKCYVATNNTKKALEDLKGLKEKRYKDAEKLYEDLAGK